MALRVHLTVLSVLLLGLHGTGVQGAFTYAMYVWRTGWDPSVPGCDVNKFLDWSDPACFTHSWNTAERRQWLWDTCNRVDRKVDELYLYDTGDALASRNCNDQRVQYLKSTLIEGRAMVSGLRVFALFSDGGVNVPEQFRIPDVVWYNEQCATGGAEERLDGVAVNNEDYDRYWPEADKAQYLQNLYQIKLEAMKQSASLGLLETHYSVGWIWGKDDNLEDMYVTWNGTNQPIMRHFVDIFDSLDVQVAFILADVMRDRLIGAEWDYATQRQKRTLPTHYINKAVPCQITFMPFPTNDPDCASWTHPYKSESAMFVEIDALETMVPGAKSCLHYHRGAYTSGGHPGWPRYTP